jgi:hypothetical protein
MTQEELARLHDEARAEMKKIPGVVGVGYGFKRTGGKLTDQVGFTVYVKEKKEKSQLKPEEIIPPEYKGIATDVAAVPQITDCDCEDHTTHSPLISGITISPLIADTTKTPPLYSVGTLGFFATINGVNGPNNVVLVSNHHVLTAGGAAAGATIYQPPLGQQDGGWAVNTDPKANNNPIGHVDNAGLEGNWPYTYPGETQSNSPGYYVDCATAKLNICVSSWCNSNCGVSFTDQVINLALNGSNAIVDIARVQQTDINGSTPYVVYKVGQRTGKTQGKVTNIGVPVTHSDPKLPGGDNGIEVTPTQPDCSNILQFANHGDSGSALINSQGKLVGIVCSVDETQSPPTTIACHIHPALDYLKVTPITKANPATGNPAFSAPAAAAQPTQSAPAQPSGAPAPAQPSAAPALRQQLVKSEEGARWIALAETHASEVIHLVNHKRRVTVTWHRNQGPQFLNEAIMNAHDVSHPIPLEIGGVTRETLLRRMAKVLADCGTAGLRAAVELNSEKITRRLQTATSLHDLIDAMGNDRELGGGRAL